MMNFFITGGLGSHSRVLLLLVASVTFYKKHETSQLLGLWVLFLL